MSDIVERMKARLPMMSGGSLDVYEEAIRDVARYVAALDEARAQVAALTAEVAELLDMNSARNEIEQERDECRNSMRFYASETQRLTLEVAALTADLKEAQAYTEKGFSERDQALAGLTKQAKRIAALTARGDAAIDLLSQIVGGIIEGTVDDVDAWEARRAALRKDTP